MPLILKTKKRLKRMIQPKLAHPMRQPQNARQAALVIKPLAYN